MAHRLFVNWVRSKLSTASPRFDQNFGEDSNFGQTSISCSKIKILIDNRKDKYGNFNRTLSKTHIHLRESGFEMIIRVYWVYIVQEILFYTFYHISIF